MTWNVVMGQCNVIIVRRNVNSGPWNVIMGECNLIMESWNVNRGPGM